MFSDLVQTVNLPQFPLVTRLKASGAWRKKSQAHLLLKLRQEDSVLKLCQFFPNSVSYWGLQPR